MEIDSSPWAISALIEKDARRAIYSFVFHNSSSNTTSLGRRCLNTLVYNRFPRRPNYVVRQQIGSSAHSAEVKQSSTLKGLHPGTRLHRVHIHILLNLELTGLFILLKKQFLRIYSLQQISHPLIRPSWAARNTKTKWGNYYPQKLAATMTEATDTTPLLGFSIPSLFTQPGAEKMSDEAVIRPDTSIPPCKQACQLFPHGFHSALYSTLCSTKNFMTDLP